MSCELSLNDSETRALLRACKAKFGLMRHQIESFDHFTQRVLPVIVRENATLIVTCPEEPGIALRQIEFTFGDVCIQPPSVKDSTGFVRNITPSMARRSVQTYASSILVDVEQRTLEFDGEIPRLVEKKLYREVLLCRLPVMVGSSVCHLHSHSAVGTECEYDDGGYFIVDGMEKVVISQEKLRTNFPYVFPARRASIATPERNAKSLLTCEVRSSHESKLRSTSTLVIHLLEPVDGSAPELLVVLPYLECPVPLAWLLRLLGWDPSTGEGGEIARLLLADHTHGSGAFRTIASTVAKSLEDEGCMITPEAVLETLGARGTHETDPERRDRYVRYICRSETLPHMGVDESPATHLAKRAYLYHMVAKLIGVWLGLTTHDDRDHYANKRVDTAGPLMAHLFRQLYRSFLKSLQGQIQRSVTANKFVDLMDSRYVNHRRISGGFKAAFGTGNWGLPKIAGGAGSAVGQVGITQALNQQTGISATAHGRRLNTPLNSQGRNPRPRQLSNSAWGVVCSTETPEGIQCGLVKNLAWGARVRLATPTSVLLPVIMAARTFDGRDMVVPLHVVASSRMVSGNDSCSGAVIVTVNGYLAGYCRCPGDAEALRDHLRTLRRYQEIPFDTTVAYLKDSWQSVVRVHADPGCLLRPVLVLSELANTRSVLARFAGSRHAEVELWAELLETGGIEYIDKDEESTLRVAESTADASAQSPVGARALLEGQPFTHAEIHTSAIHGVCASLIPFSNHNQSPRNTYQSAMGKQALGVPATNHSQRLDSVMHVLCSPERPLVATWMEDMTSSRALPAGQNAMVAILSHSGFNQEDSIIMCQSSIDAGLFASVVYRAYKEETRPNGTDVERVEAPNSETCTRLKAASYEHLDPETGAARIGARLRAGDVVIGKTVTTTDSQRGGGKVKVVRDKSQQLRNAEDGTVDRVVMATNREGQRTIRVRTAQHRVPEIGDKFCYTPDHEALTLRGWVPVKALNTEDSVFALDLDTGVATYERVMATHSYDLEDEPIYEVEAPGVSLRVTLNHRMCVKLGASDKMQLVEASDIVGQPVRYPKARYPKARYPKTRSPNIGPDPYASWYASPDDRDRAQILAIHAGYGVDYERETTGWRLHFSHEAEVTRSSRHEIRRYTGSVHCPTVRTGVLMVRRAGKAVWCGNSSRHGQKGVIGMTRARRDMPFTPEGMVPDIIVNPHAIPSRMTIGHLFETLLGAESAQAGRLGDGTPFRDLSVEQVADALAARGLDRHCETVLHCGLTGRRMEATCYFGPTYYQRLKHMVHDKVHARARGPVQPITRQPVEGRSHDGGLRIGEMERDCMAAHGASANVRECLFEKSDPYVTRVCRKCGLLADPPTIDERGWCHNCGTGENVVEIAMPFACQLTLQEITALHISPRLQFATERPSTDTTHPLLSQGITIQRP